MKSILTNFVIFAAGAGIGSVVTWNLLKSKYEKISQEEIDSVKEVYSKKFHSEESIIGKVKNVEESDYGVTFTVEPETDEQKEYIDLINNCGYKNYSRKGGSDQMSFEKPYVIPPEEFGECEYETISLTYYADKVLADDMDEIVDDVDDVVGLDSLEHFGEYEEDSVFVRNDGRKCDYEILLDVRRYSDLANRTHPHQREDE